MCENNYLLLVYDVYTSEVMYFLSQTYYTRLLLLFVNILYLGTDKILNKRYKLYLFLVE